MMLLYIKGLMNVQLKETTVHNSQCLSVPPHITKKNHACIYISYIYIYMLHRTKNYVICGMNLCNFRYI